MATDAKNGHRQHLINRILGWLPRFMTKNVKFQITISVELPTQMIPNHGAIPLIQFRVVQAWSSKNNILCITENSPISDVRFDYCNIDSRCDKCGTVTKPLGYKFDIFDEIGDKVSSFSPTDRLLPLSCCTNRVSELLFFLWWNYRFKYKSNIRSSLFWGIVKEFNQGHCWTLKKGVRSLN